MKIIALALVISALTLSGNVHSREQTAVLECGVKLGDRYHTYKTPSKPKKNRDSRFNHIAGAAQAASLRLASLEDGADYAEIAKSIQSNTVDTRLPRRFTFATLGCSWR
jgi:hypothetical protein